MEDNSYLMRFYYADSSQCCLHGKIHSPFPVWEEEERHVHENFMLCLQVQRKSIELFGGCFSLTGISSK